MFVEQNGKILLGKRGVDPERGKWGLPGGYVDYAEDPAQAAVREFIEETGLTVEITALLDVIFPVGGVTIVIAYAGRITDGTLCAADDVEAVGWFGPDDLPEIAFQSTQRILDRWKDALTRGEDIIGYPRPNH